MSSDVPPAQPDPAGAPVFDPRAGHHLRPKLRPIRGFPAKFGDRVVLGIADARQVSPKMVFTSPAVRAILPKLDGSRDLDRIVHEVAQSGVQGFKREMLEQLVAQLDDAGLLEGPAFDAMLARVRADFDSSDDLPPGPTAAFADMLVVQDVGKDATEAQKAELGPRALRTAMDGWIAKALENAEDPSLDELPRAIVAPHLDYARGWMNYAGAWGRLRVVDRPDRVVVLGTNHFGFSTGVAACDKGFRSPLGTSPYDADLGERMRARLGEPLFEHRYDHEREHSIELQVGWIHHVLGGSADEEPIPVFAALIHDPAQNNGEPYDGRGVSLQSFVGAMREALRDLGGQTLLVASADLSHVGPPFGDAQTLAGESEEAVAFRNKVIAHDREMLHLVHEKKPEALVASMAWQQNPTRWCSTGSLVATLMVADPVEVQIVNYGGAVEMSTGGMVTSVAAIMR